MCCKVIHARFASPRTYAADDRRRASTAVCPRGREAPRESELVGAYATLARGGEYLEPTVLPAPSIRPRAGRGVGVLWGGGGGGGGGAPTSATSADATPSALVSD